MRAGGENEREGGERRTVKAAELLSIIGSILGTGVALAGVMILGNANLHAELRGEMETLRAGMHAEMQELREETRSEIQKLRQETRTEIRTLRTEVHADITDVRGDIRALEVRLAAVERRQARTEGLLEGLRDAITGQDAGTGSLPM